MNGLTRGYLSIFIVLCVVSHAVADDRSPAADYLQWGGSPARNNVSTASGLPVEWNVGRFDFRTRDWDTSTARNLRWHAALGSECYGTPIVTADKVFIATNNGGGRLERFPKEVDLGVLLAFDRATGEFLWQYSSPKLADKQIDWPEQGICSVPLVEGDRLWIVTNRNEVVCLDTRGFPGGENDGGMDEPNVGPRGARVIWRFDMLDQLGATPYNMACCSPTSWGDLLFVGTSNGVDARGDRVTRPEAPSFIALDKHTGQLVWSDNTPGESILEGQWGSPACAVLGGVPQVLFPGGDGWLYSFRAERTDDGRPELLWKFDCNPKAAVWKAHGYGDRNYLVSTPVIADGLVYIATGQNPEAGEGPGDLWCIDPTRRGDVSAERVVDSEGQPVAPRRLRAMDPEAGHRAVPNPNSAALWHYRGEDLSGDGRLAYEETFHRTIGKVAVAEGLLVVGDLGGVVHCLDAKTGRCHWTHDMMAEIWGGPLLADGKIYIADADGDVCVFALSSERSLLGETEFGAAIHGSPVASDGELYFATRARLFRVGATDE